MRRLLRGALWMAGTVVLVLCVGMVAGSGALEAAAGFSSRWAVPLTGARVAGIAAVWWWWRPLVARLRWLGPDGRAYLVDRRNFYCLALCAVELLVVQNVLGAAWRWMD